uniref:Uncharacterized protein LOC104222079 n=1 Tax=Nicotiana sylvestris TaxID=4096 RepID=A0A1U7W2Y0_NICSY|nr:PREDICTED: uncharacterized protein LOC104222079 [Nicotiana sylvestris]
MGKSLCDIEARELPFRVGEEKVIFHMCKSMRKPNSNEVCSFVDLVIDAFVEDTSATINVGDMLDDILLNFDDDKMDGFMECVNSFQGMVNANRTDWSKKLDDALRAYRSAYKTPIGISPYWLVLGKACHLPVGLVHKAMWYLKKFNLDWDVATNLRITHLNELDEFRLRMFPGKLKSKWSGPFEIFGVTPFGALDLKNKNNKVFRVNGHWVKHYFGKAGDGHVVAVIHFT